MVLTQRLCLPRRSRSRGSCELCAPRPHMRAPTRPRAHAPTKEARSRRAAAFVNSGALVAEPFAPGTTTEQPAPPRMEQMRPADTNLDVPVADARRIGVVSMQLPRIAVRSQLAVDATVVSHSCTPAMPILELSQATPSPPPCAASDIRPPTLRSARRSRFVVLPLRINVRFSKCVIAVQSGVSKKLLSNIVAAPKRGVHKIYKLSFVCIFPS